MTYKGSFSFFRATNNFLTSNSIACLFFLGSGSIIFPLLVVIRLTYSLLLKLGFMSCHWTRKNLIYVSKKITCLPLPLSCLSAIIVCVSKSSGLECTISETGVNLSRKTQNHIGTMEIVLSAKAKWD